MEMEGGLEAEGEEVIGQRLHCPVAAERPCGGRMMVVVVMKTMMMRGWVLVEGGT